MTETEYTPTTNWLRIMVGYAATTATDRAKPVEAARAEGYERFDRWLAAHDAAVRADQIEKDAQIAAGDHRPTGYGIGALNSGSRSQWYSRGRDQAGVAIRAQLPALVSEPSTPDPVEPERPTCTDFHWMGQAFSSCDMCGKPFWDHVTHRGEPISDEFRAGVKRKWEVVEPVPESTTDTKGTP